MARPLRIEYAAALYHVTSRGNRQANIYEDNADRVTFVEVLRSVVDRFGWLCHAYCLMSNHYHLLIETPEANLSSGMGQLNQVYAQRFNRAHRYTLREIGETAGLSVGMVNRIVRAMEEVSK